MYLEEMKEMTEKSEFRQRLEEAMFSLDHDTIVAFLREYDVEMPEDPEQFWFTAYRIIFEVCDPPEHIVEQAIAWARANGYTIEVEVPVVGSIAC